MKKKVYIFGLTFITLFGCSKDSEDDLVDETPIPSSDKVTYNANIKVILDSNCLNCHGSSPTNGASISLNTFAGAINGVNNNNLIERISRQAGEGGAMPNGGPRLPQNLIDLVEQWKTDGLLEN